MKCLFRKEEVSWQNDYDTEDIHPDADHNIVSYYDCKNCKAWYEVYTDKKEKKNDR